MPGPTDSGARASGDGGAADLAALERAVAGRIAAERGAVAWLRGLPRAARFASLIALVAAAAGLALRFLRRADLDAYPPERMALAVAGYAGILLAASWVALRPLYLPERPWARRALVALGLALPVLIALLPEVGNGMPPGGAARQARWALTCFADGALIAAAVLLVARALDRGGGPGTLLAALAAGAIGVLLLHVHCPFNAPLHLLAGHATVPAASFGAGLWLDRRRPR